MPMPAPRMRSSAAPESDRSSVPRKRALPFAASRPSGARNTWLLPAPDSPTTPRHSPGATERAMSCAATMRPRGVSNATVRCESSSTAPPWASGAAGIEGIAQSVTEKIQAAEQQHETGRGHEQHPGRRFHLRRAEEDQVAEARVRLLHAEPEETEEALEHDHLRDAERRIHEHRAEEIRHDVTAENPWGGEPQRPRGLDELAPPQGERLPAHDAGHRQPANAA